MTILDRILDNKKKELALAKRLITVQELEQSLHFNRKTISLSEFLLSKSKTGIIAEFKRKSPSKGIINSSSSVEEVTEGYFKHGASALSILTDTQFFGGSNTDLLKARGNIELPILRKEFIFDEFQVLESKSIGADAILLIGAVLEQNEILLLARQARNLGLEVVLEIHNIDELDKVNEYISIIGVNNRNLKTFEVSTQISEMMAAKIPGGFPKISESGISTLEAIAKLRKSGYDGFLIGEKFMCTPDPVAAFSEFVRKLI
jgi:indole-3-glycerol phosphate synthase